MAADPVDEAGSRRWPTTPRPATSATPTWSGHAEVRLRRGPPDPRARLRARRQPHRVALGAGLGLPRAGGGRADRVARGRHRHRARRRTARSTSPATWRASTRTRSAASTLSAKQGDGPRRDRPGPQGRRHPRRCRGGRRARPAARPRVARALGPAPRRPPGRRARPGHRAIKGVEVGDGFDLAADPGSKAHDEIVNTADGIRRTTGRSAAPRRMLWRDPACARGGRSPRFPAPCAPSTWPPARGRRRQRSDVCAVPRRGSWPKAMAVALLADVVLEKFGGDSVQETRRNVEGYLSSLRFGERRGHQAARGPRRPDGLGQDDGRPDPRRGLQGVGLRRPRRRNRRGAHDLRHLRRRRGAGLPGTGAQAVAGTLAAHDGVLALGGEPCSTPGYGACSASTEVVFLHVGLSDSVKRVGLGSAARCCSAIRAGSSAARRAAAGVPGGRDGHRRHRRPTPRTSPTCARRSEQLERDEHDRHDRRDQHRGPGGRMSDLSTLHVGGAAPYDVRSAPAARRGTPPCSAPGCSASR